MSTLQLVQWFSPSSSPVRLAHRIGLGRSSLNGGIPLAGRPSGVLDRGCSNKNRLLPQRKQGHPTRCSNPASNKASCFGWKHRCQPGGRKTAKKAAFDCCILRADVSIEHLQQILQSLKHPLDLHIFEFGSCTCLLFPSQRTPAPDWKLRSG